MTAVIAAEPRYTYQGVQALAWRALKLFIRKRHLRVPGISEIGEKCSTVTVEARRIDNLRLQECMGLLASGVPRGALVSAAEFIKPPPEVPAPGEMLPLMAAIATERRASMQVICNRFAIRFAVTWDPAWKRISASS